MNQRSRFVLLCKGKVLHTQVHVGGTIKHQHQGQKALVWGDLLPDRVMNWEFLVLELEPLELGVQAFSIGMPLLISHCWFLVQSCWCPGGKLRRKDNGWGIRIKGSKV